MNTVKVGLSLVVLLLLWIGNIFYFQRYQLEEPLFMKHYYSIQNIGNKLEFDLFYLVNKREDVGVNRVRIPALDLEAYPAWDHERSRLKYHTVKSARLEWDETSLATLDHQAKVTEIEVEFTNGTRQRVDIGEIILNRVNMDQPYLHSQSTGSSSDHTGFSLFREKEALQLVGLKQLPPNLAPQNLTFQVNGQDINGEIQSDSFDPKPYLEVKYAFQFEKGDPRAQHVFGSDTIIEVQTDSGQMKEGILYLHYIPHWDDEAIKMLLNERRKE